MGQAAFQTENARVPAALPTCGVPCEVARGVFLLRMPLPFRLDHVNLYVLDDESGWTVVDCGLNTQETIDIWETLFGTFLRGKPVTRIIVTHLHPDHLGLARWLGSRTGAPICMTPEEWALAREVFSLPIVDRPRIQAHYQRLGLVGDSLESMVKQAASYRKLVKGLPDTVEHLHGGEVLEIGGRRWKILAGRGHSPQCICLLDEREGVLIGGDHVLPKISPNVNLLAVGSENPLDDYLASLDEFARIRVTLLLAAHGSPCTNFGERVAELGKHHRNHLLELESFCTEPRTAVDCVEPLFGRDLPMHQLYFALGESAAHLIHLMDQGRLKREGDIRWTFSRV